MNKTRRSNIRNRTRRYLKCPECGGRPVLTFNGFVCCTIRKPRAFSIAELRAAWPEIVSVSTADEKAGELSK